MLAIAVVCWSPDPHCRLPRKVSVRTYGLRWCALRASPLGLRYVPILWSKGPEGVAVISGAMRGGVVEDHACFIIFGTFLYRSPVILLRFGWGRVSAAMRCPPCRYYPLMYNISIIRHTFRRLTSTLMRDLIKLPSQQKVPLHWHWSPIDTANDANCLLCRSAWMTFQSIV